MERLEEKVDRHDVLIELLYQKVMKQGTDQVFKRPTPRSAPLPRRRSRSRSRSPVSRKKRYSDTDVFIKGWTPNTTVDEFINYVFDQYDVCVTSCIIHDNKFSARANLVSHEDQLKLLEAAGRVCNYFGFKDIVKSTA